MQFVLIIHEVADYAAWKAVFDMVAAIRREAGDIAYKVLKYDNDPNRIVHSPAGALWATRGRSSSPRRWWKSGRGQA